MGEFDQYDEEFVEDDLEQGRELQDAQIDSYEAGTIPIQKEQQNMFSFFWKVVKLGESERIIRVGNLSNTEIGEHRVSIRDSMNLFQLGHIFHHPTFGDYWAGRAKITSASSMAKQGWFMETTISQKRVRERGKNKPLSEAKQSKWRIFSRQKGIPQTEATR